METKQPPTDTEGRTLLRCLLPPTGTVLGVCAEEGCQRNATRRYRGAVYCPGHDLFTRKVAAAVAAAVALHPAAVERFDWESVPDDPPPIRRDALQGRAR